jgi:chemotaxis protein CheX
MGCHPHFMVTTPPPISDSVIERSITLALDNVFRTMLKRNVAFVEKTTAETIYSTDGAFQVLGSVSFVGATNGIVYLCLTDGFAAHVVGHVIGTCATDADLADHDLVKDVIGELTNMTAGGFKNALCDLGYPCKLTLPTIVRGRCVKVSAFKSSLRHVFVFNSSGQRIIADIQLNNG